MLSHLGSFIGDLFLEHPSTEGRGWVPPAWLVTLNEDVVSQPRPMLGDWGSICLSSEPTVGTQFCWCPWRHMHVPLIGLAFSSREYAYLPSKPRKQTEGNPPHLLLEDCGSAGVRPFDGQLFPLVIPSSLPCYLS